jgi:hypothetical protein
MLIILEDIEVMEPVASSSNHAIKSVYSIIVHCYKRQKTYPTCTKLAWLCALDSMFQVNVVPVEKVQL